MFLLLMLGRVIQGRGRKRAENALLAPRLVLTGASQANHYSYAFSHKGSGEYSFHRVNVDEARAASSDTL